MKKNKIILIIYMLIMCLFLCGCANKEDEQEVDKKIQSEIEYLDKKIIGLMNKLNNITLENYEVKSKEIKSKKQNGNTSEESSNGSSNEGSSEGSSSKDETSKEGSSSNSSSGGESSNESEGSSENIKVLQMQPSNILVIDKEDIDWATIKSEVEEIYSSWNSILLDLYSINIENDDILSFGNALDNAVISVRDEDKKASLQALANLYSYLPKYANSLSIEESTKNILQTKSNILNAYAIIEQENWEEVQNQINQADIAYTKVTNDINYIQKKQEQVGKIYVLIKELKSSIGVKDKDIFYIKYKNLMNAIN